MDLRPEIRKMLSNRYEATGEASGVPKSAYSQADWEKDTGGRSWYLKDDQGVRRISMKNTDFSLGFGDFRTICDFI